MALIKLGALTQDVRGSLNGTTFSRNRGGAYVRTKVSPVQPHTPAQSVARASFSAIAKLWATGLSAEQRLAWSTYASTHPYTNIFGDSIILSGIAIFQAISRALNQIGVATLLPAPTLPPPLDINGITATVVTAAGVPTITVTPTHVPTPPQGLYIFATRPLAPGQIAHSTDYRLINTQAGGAIVSPWDISDEYLARFVIATIPVGCRIGIAARPIDPATGLHIAPYRLTVQSTGT